MKLKALLGAALLAGSLATPAVAVELKPLASQAEGAARSYLPTRCAALYRSFAEWGGEERLGDLWHQYDDLQKKLFVSAARMLNQDGAGGTLEASADIALRDVLNIGSLYQARFEQNYAATGSAFAEDPQTQSDMQSCKTIVETLDRNGWFKGLK